jgi:hypothetical protein
MEEEMGVSLDQPREKSQTGEINLRGASRDLHIRLGPDGRDTVTDHHHHPPVVQAGSLPIEYTFRTEDFGLLGLPGPRSPDLRSEAGREDFGFLGLPGPRSPDLRSKAGAQGSGFTVFGVARNLRFLSGDVPDCRRGKGSEQGKRGSKTVVQTATVGRTVVRQSVEVEHGSFRDRGWAGLSPESGWESRKAPLPRPFGGGTRPGILAKTRHGNSQPTLP